MKRILITMVLILDVAFGANAANEIVDGVTWYYETFSDNGKTCARIISGQVEYVGDLKIPSALEGNPVTEIQGGAFYLCTGVTSVAIPEGVRVIGNGAFYMCTGLRSVSIPESVVGIGSSAFCGCCALEAVEIPSCVTYIGESAFSGCVGLTAVVIPSNVKRIENWTFDDCRGLKSVTISEGVTSIGQSAFLECCGLTQVLIPSSVTSVGSWAFSRCDGLCEIMVAEGNPSYKVVNNCLVSIDGTLLVAVPYGCREVNIPGGVLELSDYVFESDVNLRAVTIPSGVRRISDAAFKDCSGLTSIVIPEGVSIVGNYAFEGCGGLESVAIPSSVIGIYYRAFAGCSSLKTVYVGRDCDVDALKKMLQESGVDVNRVTFDYVDNLDRVDCKVVFNAQGGTAAWTEVTVPNGEAVGELPVATRDGYEFLGWFTAAGGGTQVTAATVVTEDVTFYAQWRVEAIAMPMVDPPDGAVFKSESCAVSITCETEDASVYYRVGAAPKPSSRFLYSAPFTIADTSTIYTYAMKDGRSSPTNVVKITKGHVLTLAEATSAEGISAFITGGDVEWTAEEDVDAKVGNASVRSGEIDDNQESWFTAEVEGPGTLSFWWKASCEADELQDFDHLVFAVDDVVEGEVARLDGITAWERVTATVPAGSHTLYWAYVKDESDFEGEDCGWVDGVVWTPSVAPVVNPTVEGDEGATVTGDAETGFVIKPSEGTTSVEVTIPQGVDAAKVTVEVSPKVASVKPNGAKVKIVSGGADITEFLDMPTAGGDGVVDLTKAVVKEEIVREALDVEKGAVIDLSGGALGTTGPTITTAPTRIGLLYQFREGTKLEGFGSKMPSATKDGDGKPWSPMINVKGGSSAFYSIGVGMPEK